MSDRTGLLLAFLQKGEGVNGQAGPVAVMRGLPGRVGLLSRAVAASLLAVKVLWPNTHTPSDTPGVLLFCCCGGFFKLCKKILLL